MCFHQLGLYSFFGCRRTLNVHQRQDTRLIHNEVGWFAFLQGKKKNAPVLCVFCGSLMNYWSFFYLVSAQLFFRIQKCCFLSEHSWIVFFFVFLFLFLYIPYTLSRPPPNSPLAQCSVSLRPLHPPVLPPLPLYSLFSLSRCHIIPFTMVLPSPCHFFFYPLQWFLFKSPLSSLYIPQPPLSCRFSSQIISLPFYFYPFSSPTLSLTASNMVYSLSGFPECEECCCFWMSPA